jgi:acetolactate synthase-1/2/3 large subunit
MSDGASTAEVMAEALVAAGISSIFAYPGDPIIELMEKCRARGVDVVLARREATAAFMAEGFAQATGRPGVCLSTLGPGSTALVNGAAAAYLDRVPMLAISGQIESAGSSTSPTKWSITSCSTARSRSGPAGSSRPPLRSRCARPSG